MDMSEGTIKWFNAKKGFGFINNEDGPDVFLHFSEITGTRKLREGDKVSYELVQGEMGPKAAKVTKK